MNWNDAINKIREENLGQSEPTIQNPATPMYDPEQIQIELMKQANAEFVNREPNPTTTELPPELKTMLDACPKIEELDLTRLEKAVKEECSKPLNLATSGTCPVLSETQINDLASILDGYMVHCEFNIIDSANNRDFWLDQLKKASNLYNIFDQSRIDAAKEKERINEPASN